MAQNTGLVVQSEDKLSVMVRNLHPTKLQLKPLTQSTVKPETAGKGGRRGGGEGERGRHQAEARAEGEQGRRREQEERAVAGAGTGARGDQSCPTSTGCSPCRSRDGAHAQDAHTVELHAAAKAAQISLREDLRTAVGYKGYRMVRATHRCACGQRAHRFDG